MRRKNEKSLANSHRRTSVQNSENMHAHKKNNMQIQVNLFLFISRPGKKCLLESNLQIRYDLMSNNGEMSIQTVTLKWAKKKICPNMQKYAND